jgi:hypothetical protein
VSSFDYGKYPTQESENEWMEGKCVYFLILRGEGESREDVSLNDKCSVVI